VVTLDRAGCEVQIDGERVQLYVALNRVFSEVVFEEAETT
jgi:hypothetical protein